MLEYNAKLDFVDHTPQPKVSALQPEHPAGAICSAHEGVPLWHRAAPCTNPGF